MKTRLFHSTCQGESHLSSGKPCQDCSYSESAAENGLCDILVVSDGHGSAPFFRSDRGARLAVKVAVEAVFRFVSRFIPRGCPPLVSRGIAGVTDCSSEDFTLGGDPNEASFRQLASYILARWYEAVDEDWLSDPPSPDETTDGDTPPERAYGCTLQVAFRTEDYWAAMQLGDGKIVAFWPDGTWTHPVPWDSECFQTSTTSLCSHREDRFRYCYGTRQPAALFLGSDGMDDSFRQPSELAHFYGTVLTRMSRAEMATSLAELGAYLPELSRKGSQDDMSVALWVDEEALLGLREAIRQKEQEAFMAEAGRLRERISEEVSGLLNTISQLSRLLSRYEVPVL